MFHIAVLLEDPLFDVGAQLVVVEQRRASLAATLADPHVGESGNIMIVSCDTHHRSFLQAVAVGVAAGEVGLA